MRWSEEVHLLLEEMRRVLAYFEWHERWWLSLRERWEGLPAAQMEGLRAYAERQASLRRNLSKDFRSHWTYVSKWVDMHILNDEVCGLDRAEWHDAGVCPVDAGDTIDDSTPLILS
jgi:hypothetical protein